MKLTIDINNQEYCEDGANVATVELTAEDMADILKLAQLCSDNHLYKVCRFENPLTFFSTDWSGEEENGTLAAFDGRLEAVTLNVTEKRFFWAGYYKHSDYRFETTRVYLSETADQSVEYDLRDYQ